MVQQNEKRNSEMKKIGLLFGLLLVFSASGIELCNSAQWQEKQQGKRFSGWVANDFNRESAVEFLPGKICRITAETIGRGYLRWQKKCNIPAGSVFRFSGKYRTENIEFSQNGFLRAELKLNPGAERRQRKSKALRLAPSAEWKAFSEELIAPVQVELCSITFMMFKAKGSIEFRDLKLELAEGAKGKLSPDAITVWRECEDVFTGGGLAPGGPSSGKGKQYLARGKFSYRFKPFAETDPASLLPRARKFYIWVRLYGYVEKTPVDVALDGKKIFSFETKNTEKPVNQRMTGEYYWQRAGVLTTTGAPCELTFTGKGRMAFDAMLFTTDPAYIPAEYEARNSKQNAYFTDLKLPVSIKPRYPVNGIAVNAALPVTFEFTTPKRRKIFRRGTVLLELPKGVRLVDAVSQWSGKNWKSSPQVADYLKIHTEKQQDGGSICKIELSCISLALNVFLQADENQIGKKVPLYWSFKMGDNEQPREKIFLEVLRLPEAEPFQKIRIGTEELFQGFYSDFPDLFATCRKFGLNMLTFKHYFRGKNPAAWEKLSAGAKTSDITLVAAYSPRFPFSGKNGRAVDINGKTASEPCLMFRADSPWDKKDLDNLAELGRDFDLLVLDDENTNRRVDKIDYHPDVLAAFAKFRKAKKLPEVDIKQVVRKKQFDSEAYLSWVDFKCELMAEHYRFYAQAARRYNPRAAVLPCIMKDISTAELRRNSYWDYLKLLPHCPVILPMIYTYMGVRDSYKVGDIMDMHNREAGRPVISTYLLAEHRDFGIVRPENKPMMKYQIWESLMGQAKYIFFFSGNGVFNPVNLRYIAEGIAIARPYEDFFVKGKPAALQAQPEWLRVRALELDGKLLIYYANYANDLEKTGEILLPDGRRLHVDFKKDRAGFILTETQRKQIK